MRTYKLAIADTDTQYTSEMDHYLRKCADFEIVGIVNDGIKALHLIQNKHPDIVLMDLLLPNLDGLCLLKEIQKMPSSPLIICLSEFCSMTSVEAACKNGASYYIYKPAEIPSIITILREYASLLQMKKDNAINHKKMVEEKDIVKEVYSVMHRLGFSAKLNGSHYLAEAVILAHESPLMVRNLSSELYSELAHRCNTTSSCIERGMRTAIADADVGGRLTEAMGTSPTNKRCIRYVLTQINSMKSSMGVL